MHMFVYIYICVYVCLYVYIYMYNTCPWLLQKHVACQKSRKSALCTFHGELKCERIECSELSSEPYIEIYLYI